MQSDTRKWIIVLLILIPVIIVMGMLIKDFDIEFNLKEIHDISFRQFNNINDVKQYDGKRVRIMGYVSPMTYGVSYIYLTSKPYATDIFVEGEYSSIAVYSKDGKIIPHSNYPVYVTGDLVFGDFEDTQGNKYKYRIENAEVVNATLEQVEGLVEKYYILAQDNILNGLNNVLGQMDKMIYYDEYKEMGYEESFLEAVDIASIDALSQRVEQYNDETYDTVGQVLTNLKTMANELNELLEKKDYDKFVEYKEKFEEIYYNFYYYIREFSV